MVSNPGHGTKNCKRGRWYKSDQHKFMSIKSIHRYSSTWCHREKSWSRHQNCKRIGLGTQGISQLLFIRFTPEFLSLVPQELSWSQHQKLQEDWLGTKDEIGNFNSSLLYLLIHAPIRITRGVPLLVYMNLDVYSGFWCTSHCVVF